MLTWKHLLRNRNGRAPSFQLDQCIVLSSLENVSSFSWSEHIPFTMTPTLPLISSLNGHKNCLKKIPMLTWKHLLRNRNGTAPSFQFDQWIMFSSSENVSSFSWPEYIPVTMTPLDFHLFLLLNGLSMN